MTRPVSRRLRSRVQSDIRKGNISGIESFLLSTEGDVNAVVNDRGTSLIIYATEYGQTDVVRVLLEKGGVDTNAKNANGMTALMKAYEGGHMDIVDMLLESGVDSNIRNQSGKTAHFYLTKFTKENTNNNDITEEQGDNRESTHVQTLPHVIKEREYNDEIEALIYSTRNILDLKIVYTIVSHNYRCRYISMDDFRSYAHKALEHIAQLLTDTTDSVVFKYILKKAEADDLITEFERKKFKMEATKAVVLNSDCIQSLKRSIKSIQGRLDVLEHSLQKVQKNHARSVKVKAALAFPKAILNIFTLGVAGSTMEAMMEVAMSQIVDFGDTDHIIEVLGDASESESALMFEEGVEAAEDTTLEDAYEYFLEESEGIGEDMVGDLLEGKEKKKIMKNYNFGSESEKEAIFKQIGFAAQLSKKEAHLLGN